MSASTTVADLTETEHLPRDAAGSARPGGSTLIRGHAARARGLRGSVLLVARRFEARLSSMSRWLGLAPLVGVEVELAALFDGARQLHTGLRGGSLLSSRHDFRAGECASPTDRSRPRSRAVFEAIATASGVHLVRVAMVAEQTPALHTDERSLSSRRPETGVRLFRE